MKTIKVSQVQKTKKIEGLKVGDKIFASLATWYKKSDWGKTPYGSVNSLKQRFLEGVVNEIRQRKSAPRHKIFKIKFEAMEGPQVFWLSAEKLVSNDLYVVSEFHLPKDGFVIKNLNVNLDAVVKKTAIDFHVGETPETLQAALSENALLREKLVEASALISNYASTIEQIDFRVEKISYSSNNKPGVFVYPEVLGTPVPKRTDMDGLNYSRHQIQHLEQQRVEAENSLKIRLNVGDSRTMLYDYTKAIIGKFNAALKVSANEKRKTVQLLMAGDFFWKIFGVLIKLALGIQKSKSASKIKFQVDLKVLKRMGINVQNSEDFASPFCRASFYEEEEAKLGSYYSKYWDEISQKHKMVINPCQLSFDELRTDTRIIEELGPHYQFFNQAKTIHDIMMKRISYDGEFAEYCNYGLRSWSMIDGSKPILITGTNFSSETSLVQVTFSFKVESRRFSIFEDVRTGYLLPYAQDAALNADENQLCYITRATRTGRKVGYRH